jgi:hypothetical protein
MYFPLVLEWWTASILSCDVKGEREWGGLTKCCPKLIMMIISPLQSLTHIHDFLSYHIPQWWNTFLWMQDIQSMWIQCHFHYICRNWHGFNVDSLSCSQWVTSAYGCVPSISTLGLNRCISRDEGSPWCIAIRLFRSSTEAVAIIR